MKLLSFKLFIEAHGIQKHYGAESLDSILKGYGWKPIGSGKYATVWEVPNQPYVIKTWTNDEAYESFVEFAQKNQDNKHSPKIIGRMKSIPAVYKRTNKNETVKLLKIEKLYPIDETTWKAINHILHQGRTTEYDGEHHYDADEPEYHKRNKWTYRDIKEDFPDAESFLQYYLKLLDYLRDNHIGGSIDQSKNNFMKRKDGTIVVVDPLFYDDTYSLANLYRLERGDDDYEYEYDEEDYHKKPHYKIKDKINNIQKKHFSDPDEEIPF